MGCLAEVRVLKCASKSSSNGKSLTASANLSCCFDKSVSSAYKCDARMLLLTPLSGRVISVIFYSQFTAVQLCTASPAAAMFAVQMFAIFWVSVNVACITCATCSPSTAMHHRLWFGWCCQYFVNSGTCWWASIGYPCICWQTHQSNVNWQA